MAYENRDYTHLSENEKQRIELIAQAIRNKVYGIDVRESIALAIEWVNREYKLTIINNELTLKEFENAKSKVSALELDMDEFIQRYSAQVAGNTSLNETIDARVDATGISHTTLKDRLDKEHTEVATQLSQTVKALGTANVGKNIKKPAISIITDDGYNGDVDYMLPISKRTGVPFSTAIITSRMPDSDPRGISKDEILMLQNEYGWEILSHTVDHINLSTLSRAEQEYQINQSKQDLLDIGADVKNIAYPFGGYNKDTLELARKYYRGGRSTDFGLFGGINSSPIDTYALNMIWMDSRSTNPSDPSGLTINTPEYYKYYIDLAIEKKGWLIILLHSNDTQVAGLGPVLEETINYGKSKGVDFLTMDQGLDRFGNAVDVGESVEQQPDFSDHFLVGYDGQIRFKGLPTVFEGQNAFDGNSPFSEFKDFSITINRVDTQRATETGLPEGLGGLLVTMRTVDRNGAAHYDYDTQFYITIFNDMYIRGRTTSDEFTKWKSLSGYSVDSSVKFTDNMDTFPEGITYSPISHANGTISPTGQGGLLITNIYDNEYGFNYQTFKAFDSDDEYTRGFNYDGTPKSWTKKTQYVTVGSAWTALPSKTFTKVEIPDSRIDYGDFVVLNPTSSFPDDFIFTAHVKNGKVILHVYNPRSVDTALEPMDWKVKVN